MRAVHLEIPEAELRERRLHGLDRLDEMWEGELHMVPLPSLDHQDIVSELTRFLRNECGRRAHGRVYCQTGLHDPDRPKDSFRAPDLSFVAKGNEKVLQKRGIVGAADSVIEIRSPEDETYEKFPFFARLGVREVIVIPLDTRRPEVYRLSGRKYVALRADRDGWIAAAVLGIRLRAAPGPRRARVEALDDPRQAVEF